MSRAGGFNKPGTPASKMGINTGGPVKTAAVSTQRSLANAASPLKGGAKPVFPPKPAGINTMGKIPAHAPAGVTKIPGFNKPNAMGNVAQTKVSGLGTKVSGLGKIPMQPQTKVSGLGTKVSGLGKIPMQPQTKVSGLGTKVSGLGKIPPTKAGGINSSQFRR